MWENQEGVTTKGGNTNRRPVPSDVKNEPSIMKGESLDSESLKYLFLSMSRKRKKPIG